MEVKELIEKIRRCHRGFLPKSLLRQLDLENQEVRDALRRELGRLGQRPGGEVAVMALYLLAAVEDPVAGDLVLEAIKGEGADVSEALEDVLESDFSSILVALLGKKMDVLRSLGMDRSSDDAIRSSVLEAMLVLFSRGLVERAPLLAYYHLLLDRAGQESSDFMAVVAHCLAHLQDPELREFLDEAYREEWIDAWVLPRDEVEERFDSFSLEECLAHTKEQFDRQVKDPIELLEKLELFARGFQTERNALCPCGSGKKFKSCCL